MAALRSGRIYLRSAHLLRYPNLPDSASSLEEDSFVLSSLLGLLAAIQPGGADLRADSRIGT